MYLFCFFQPIVHSAISPFLKPNKLYCQTVIISSSLDDKISSTLSGATRLPFLFISHYSVSVAVSCNESVRRSRGEEAGSDLADLTVKTCATSYSRKPRAAAGERRKRRARVCNRGRELVDAHTGVHPMKRARPSLSPTALDIPS
jgi:hypothetical protein